MTRVEEGTVTPLNAAAAVYLNAQATGDEPLIPITDAPDPEIARLLLMQIERGGVPDEEYIKAMRKLKVTKRTIQRKLSDLRKSSTDAPRGRPKSFEITDYHRQVIFACDGNAALAHAELEAAGAEVPDYKVFWRAWSHEPSGIQAYARKGADGMVDFWLYPPYEAPARNAVWQADHFELPNDVVADGHTTQLVKPWLTVFEDDKTRKLMGWSLTAEPGRRADAVSVTATIASAVRIRHQDGIEVGGIPLAIRWDNDLSFTAGMVTDLGSRLGFECHAVPPYSGHMKGKVERLGRRIQEQFCVLQPAYTHGARTYRQKDPVRDTAPLTAAEMRLRLAAWFDDYDRTDHTTLDRSPLEAWDADTTPLRRATNEELRSALLVAKKAHKVHPRKGVHFAGQWWMGAGMIDIVNCKVEVRYPVGEPDFIEVFHEGRWRSTGWPAMTLSDSQKQQIWDRRRDMYEQARAIQDGAVRMRVDASSHTTDATPAVAAEPATDLLSASADDLYDLLQAVNAPPPATDAKETS